MVRHGNILKKLQGFKNLFRKNAVGVKPEQKYQKDSLPLLNDFYLNRFLFRGMDTLEVRSKTLKRNDDPFYIVSFQGYGDWKYRLKAIASKTKIFGEIDGEKKEFNNVIISFNHKKNLFLFKKVPQVSRMISDGIAQVQRLIDAGVRPEKIVLEGSCIGGTTAIEVAKHFFDKEKMALGLFPVMALSTTKYFYFDDKIAKNRHEIFVTLKKLEDHIKNTNTEKAHDEVMISSISARYLKKTLGKRHLQKILSRKGYHEISSLAAKGEQITTEAFMNLIEEAKPKSILGSNSVEKIGLLKSIHSKLAYISDMAFDVGKDFNVLYQNFSDRIHFVDYQNPDYSELSGMDDTDGMIPQERLLGRFVQDTIRDVAMPIENSLDVLIETLSQFLKGETVDAKALVDTLNNDLDTFKTKQQAPLDKIENVKIFSEVISNIKNGLNQDTCKEAINDMLYLRNRINLKHTCEKLEDTDAKAHKDVGKRELYNRYFHSTVDRNPEIHKRNVKESIKKAGMSTSEIDLGTTHTVRNANQEIGNGLPAFDRLICNLELSNKVRENKKGMGLENF